MHGDFSGLSPLTLAKPDFESRVSTISCEQLHFHFIFKQKCQTIHRSKLLKSKYLLVFFNFYDNILKTFGFWTVSPTKQLI